ncbi:MAG: DUF4350 domain-containing protein [Variovorax sp.]
MRAIAARVVIALLLVAAAVWIVMQTEWYDREVPTLARGEAASNPLYATQLLLRQLGQTVVKRSDLSALPPNGARLVLVSQQWDLFPERVAQLEGWVEAGGQLILPGELVNHDSLVEWLPIGQDDLPEPRKPPRRGQQDGPFSKLPNPGGCRLLHQTNGMAGGYAGRRSFKVCGLPPSARFLPADADIEPLWSVEGAATGEFLRVPFGRGSVTVVGEWSSVRNDHALREDNPLVIAAALQAGSGSEIWFVVEESREAFPLWLWHRGWAAIALALLALVAAVWRVAPRFGPLLQPPGRARRSMAEQVRGTAEFLQRHGGEALLAAQLRALRQAATRHLRRQAQDVPATRDGAIATATGIDANDLRRAGEARRRSPAALAADLELLETARRRLEANGPMSAPAAARPSSSTPST